MNVVVVAHQGTSGKYMFKVPDAVQLRAGDIVLCNTKLNPRAIGMCVTDSFVPADPASIAKLWGSSVEGMRPVIGKLNPEMYDYEPANEADDEYDF